MDKKNIVIVGASSGIGAALAQILESQDYEVYGLSRTPSQVGHYIEYDALSDEEPLGLPEVIDGFVYCPGSISLKPFRSLKIDQYKEEMELNFFGALRALKLCLKAMKNSKSIPSVVFFSTVAVGQGMPFHSSIASAKGAIEGLTRSLAAELAPTIRVNCIAPSLTDTPLAAAILSSPERVEASGNRHPLKRVGSATDIAELAHFILSEKSSWITGQVIAIDGGMSTVRV